MSEVALDSGSVSTPAETTGAPLPEVAVDVPNALGSQTPVAEKPAEPEQPKSTREALRTAMDAVKAKETAKVEDNGAKPAEPKDPKAVEKPADVKAEPKAEVKTDAKPAERSPDGKFAPKATDPQAQPSEAVQKPAEQQAKPKFEAPARFDEVAKRDWETAPESVKGATSRVIRELETGIQEHQKRWEPIKQYDELAKQYQTDLPSALERYVSMDKLLSQDLATGLDSVIRDKTGGQMGLREFVAQLTGQQPDQATAQADRTTHELRQQVAGLEKQLSAVVGHIRQQAADGIGEKVNSFSADKPDFDALSDKIVEHIGKGLSLEAAYDAAKQEAEAIARSLGFVPASEVSQPLSPASQPVPLKPAGQKSVSGAPATGSDPASQKKAPASSIREALERAKARVG
jgi:hypothetical protein